MEQQRVAASTEILLRKRASSRLSLRPVSLKDERLARKMTLAFGFLSFIPLLLVLLALVALVFPHVEGQIKDALHFVVMGIIVSIFVGYFVLKQTTGSVMDLVRQARQVTQRQLGQSPEQTDGSGGNEVAELAMTFHRITQELEHKVQELETSRASIKRLLARIGHVLVSYEGIDNLLELIVENVSTALEAQLGSILLVDHEHQELEVKTTWSVTDQRVDTQRIPMGQGIAGWVAKEARAIRGTGSPTAVGFSEGRITEGAVLCVPLPMHGKASGVISVLREDAARAFTEDDELLLGSIGSQIAVAMENYQLNLDIEHTYLEMITALALAVEAKESYTAGHSKRVGLYAVKIAEVIGLDEESKKVLKNAGILHDVGKIGVRDDILLKPSLLTAEEERVMRQHSIIGEAILKPVRSLGKVAELVRHHHEDYDGSGYPMGLKGEDIPLAARILRVADSYDSMVTDRPYRKRLSAEQAIDELRKDSGKKFDPAVVDAFLKVLAEK